MVKPATSYSSQIYLDPILDENGAQILDENRSAIASELGFARQPTAYGSTSKYASSYARNTSVAAWLLNSTVVTLNSTTYRLNGYTTATAPNQLSNRPATSWA